MCVVCAAGPHQGPGLKLLHDSDLPRGSGPVHYASARSVACQQSRCQQGIATVTVVQPNRPADIDARGSGAATAGVWAGPPKHWHAGGAVAHAGAGPGEVPRHISYMIY